MTAGVEVPFFDQIGITNVVWLDDLFDVPAAPSEIDIAEQIGTSIANGVVPQHQKLADLSLDDSAQEWARRIRDRMEGPEIAELLKQIAQPAETPTTLLDYSPAELSVVVSALSSTIQRVGLGEWAARKEQLLASAASGVFLVDRERIIDGEPTIVGDDIVRDVVSGCADDVLVVVLTHSVGPDGTETFRQSLATELAVPPSRLGVVSKRPKGASLANDVRAAVRITLTELTCAMVTGRIARAMRASIGETQKALNSLPVQVLDHAVFENSLKEGASEIDVLSRILSSRQRTAVDVHVAGALDDIHSPLARMRRLRLLQPLPDLPGADLALLRQWRRDEVFDLGDRLNALRSPLACGDVFRKDGTSKLFVLLGQPCDLIVRSDGQRSAREAVFVKLTSPYAPSTGTDGRYFEVPPLDGTERWALDFRSWASVNLECLEWASFNNDGRVAFSPSQGLPLGVLPGWERRFERARNKFSTGRNYCLSLGKIPGASAVASDTTVTFPYSRIARLRGPWAVGAYSAFANFHARGAFDHDFTQGLAETVAEPGPQV